MLITIPGSQIVDDGGALVSGASAAVASITDKLGSPLAGAAATVNLAGPNLSVDYDVAANGNVEAWITLAVSKAGSVFTQQRAAPVVFASRDSGLVAGDAATDAATAAAVTGLPAALVAALNADPLYAQLVHHLLNKFTYNPATHSLQAVLDNGTTPLGGPMTLTVDAAGNVTARR